jgi:L-fuconolactonase
MAERHLMVRGIRRIVDFEPDPRGLTLSDSFVEGVNLRERFGMHFEINVNHTHMDIVRDFVKRIPRVPMILDHCGKPGVAERAIDQYRADIAELARHPNLWIELSDIPVEADHDHWTEDDLKPFIDATLEAFGAPGILYAGDYPVCLQATTLPRGRGSRPCAGGPFRNGVARDLSGQCEGVLPVGAMRRATGSMP